MLQVTEARERLLGYFTRGETETVDLKAAAQRVLAQTISAQLDSPPFTQSAMDGVAVRFADLQKLNEGEAVRLKIVGKAAAGDGGGFHLGAGEAALIMTGAVLPQGADTVVRVEDTNLDFSAPGSFEEVVIYSGAPQGDNIRYQGENYAAGSPILEAGHKILPQDVGMLATLGKSDVLVYKQPVIGIFSSGDELVEPGENLAAGKIYNSNSYMIRAMIEQCGGEILDLGIIPDTIDSVRTALATLASRKVDLILTSGGVSMGIHDYIRRVVSEDGELNFWKVNLRPGKPLAFGHYHGVPFIGLPGNPVSSYVGTLIFVCPAITKMSGGMVSGLEMVKARLTLPLSTDSRETYLPGRCQVDENELRVTPVGNQSSGNLFALVQGNCLIKIAPGVQSLKQDSLVEIWKFSK